MSRDQVALVTGGASGLGRGLVEALCREGARVVIADIDLEGAEALARELTSSAHPPRALRLDVTDAASVEAAIADLCAHEGRLDLLFNNAGIGVGGELQDLEPGPIRRIIDINLTGAIFVMRAAYALMVRQRSGTIVNIASMWGLCPAVLQSVYGATKHGLVAMSLATAAEGRELGIRVTAICPGYIQTNLFAAASYAGDLDAERAVERIPFPMLEVDRAVAAILGAAKSGRLIAPFPFYVRFMWWLQRLSPWLMMWLSSREVRRQRRMHGSTALLPPAD